ncbi:MAG: LamG domain-containing protein [Proteobacteria bacterium]|nr:LamG domain-containing protein [Pseudomonadota bacterium]
MVCLVFALVAAGVRFGTRARDNSARATPAGLELAPGGFATVSLDAPARGRFAVELALASRQPPGARLSSILAGSSRSGEARWVLAQWSEGLLWRLERPAPSAGAPDEIWVRVPLDRDTHHVVLAADPTTARVFVNGALLATREIAPRLADAGPQRLVLGDVDRGLGGWRGLVSGLAVWDGPPSPDEVRERHREIRRTGFPALAARPGLRALYTAERNASDGLSAVTAHTPPLLRPAHWPPPRPLEAFPARLGGRAAVLDGAANALCFAPFGLLFVWSRPRARGLAAWGTAVAAAALLSGLLEAAQLQIPGRVPAVADWLANVTGAAAGAGIGLAQPRNTDPHG